MQTAPFGAEPFSDSDLLLSKQETQPEGTPRESWVRFLSVEPLLEDLGEINLEGIHWVIVGGESGPGARPMQKEWVTSLRDQCERAKVHFFFKQWGGVR